MDIPFVFFLLPLNSEIALYFFFVAILVLSGIGLPIPEEVTLLFGGYLAYLEFMEFSTTVYALAAGIVLADIMGYCLGRFFGGYLEKRISHLRIAEMFLARARRLFEKHGERFVLYTRPLLGVRVGIPILAGNFKMNFFKFLLFDALGALPWTLLLVSISYYFGVGLDLITEVREIKYAIILLSVIGILIFAARIIKKGKNASMI